MKKTVIICTTIVVCLLIICIGAICIANITNTPSEDTGDVDATSPENTRIEKAIDILKEHWENEYYGPSAHQYLEIIHTSVPTFNYDTVDSLVSESQVIDWESLLSNRIKEDVLAYNDYKNIDYIVEFTLLTNSTDTDCEYSYYIPDFDNTVVFYKDGSAKVVKSVGDLYFKLFGQRLGNSELVTVKNMGSSYDRVLIDRIVDFSPYEETRANPFASN